MGMVVDEPSLRPLGAASGKFLRVLGFTLQLYPPSCAVCDANVNISKPTCARQFTVLTQGVSHRRTLQTHTGMPTPQHSSSLQIQAAAVAGHSPQRLTEGARRKAIAGTHSFPVSIIHPS